MPNNPREVVTGRCEPVIDRSTGRQREDPKKGKKWRITAELPRCGHKQKRPRKYRDVYGSERKAKREMEKFVAEINEQFSQNYIPARFISADTSRITFKEHLENWLEASKNGGLKRRTWEIYASYAKNHIIPCLGHVTLKEMSPFHISRYKELKLKDNQRLDGKKGKLSAKTINHQLSIISDALEDAASNEKQLIFQNPALMVKRVKDGGRGKKTAAVNCLTLKQLNDLLYRLSLLYSLRRAGKETKEKPETVETLKRLGFTDKEISSNEALFKFRVTMLYPVVYLAARTGMRLSELLALKWRDINLEEKAIRVYESSHYGKKMAGEESSQHLNSTKEGKPKAFIKISDEDVEFLKHYRKEQQKQRLCYSGEYRDSDLVFARKNGDYLYNTTVSEEFSRFAKDNHFPVTFHGLRHTHCTLLLAAGVQPMYVARRVGHCNPATTSAIYSHAECAEGRNLGEVFSGILNGTEEPNAEKVSPGGEKTADLLKHIGS